MDYDHKVVKSNVCEQYLDVTAAGEPQTDQNKQVRTELTKTNWWAMNWQKQTGEDWTDKNKQVSHEPVSYTHLTLPTNIAV